MEINNKYSLGDSIYYAKWDIEPKDVLDHVCPNCNGEKFFYINDKSKYQTCVMCKGKGYTEIRVRHKFFICEKVYIYRIICGQPSPYNNLSTNIYYKVYGYQFRDDELKEYPEISEKDLYFSVKDALQNNNVRAEDDQRIKDW